MVSLLVIITIIIIALFIISLIVIYNGLVRLKNQVKNAWAQIDVQLKRRTDLIPNLIETVKGYAKHEKDLFENVTKARSAILNAGADVKAVADANNMLSSALKSVFAVAENYPDLKANTNFLQLQEELTGTENKVAATRQFYNDVVMEYNTKLETFPTNMVASIFNFKKSDLFEIDEKEKEVPKVSF